MKKCMNCGAELPEEASFCPYCTATQNEKHQVVPRWPRRKWLWMAGCAAVVVGILLLAVWRWNVRTAGEEMAPAPSQTVSAKPTAAPSPAASPQVSEMAAQAAPVSAEEPQTASEAPDTSEEMVYTDEDGDYEIFLCFDNNGLSPPQGSREITMPEGAVGNIPSILVVNKDGTRAREEFLEKVEAYYVEAVPKAGFTAMELSEPRIEYEMPPATLMCDVGIGTECGTNDIFWTLEMKNGEVLTLKQTVTVLAPKTMDIYPEDEPMDTVEELQALLDRLDQLAGADTIVNIYLPPVTYQGDLQISRHSASLLGATDNDGNAATVFEGSIRISTEQPDLVCLMNLRLIGPGSGTGLNVSAGIQLERCYLTGWDVAAVSNHGGWIGAHYSTFEGNGVGLKFKTSQHGHTDRGYIYNVFTNNDIAVQIEETACDKELLFDQSQFSGNGIDIDNQIDQLLDLSGAIME